MAYRSLRGAVRARIQALEQEQSAIEARLRELGALLERKSELGQELRAAYETFDRVGPRSPPLLVPGATPTNPCRESWVGMIGDDSVRCCGRCAQHVYDFTGMTAGEAEVLAYATELEVVDCFLNRPDGTFTTKLCSGGRQREHRRLLVAGLGLVALGATFLASTSGGTASVPSGSQRGSLRRQVGQPSQGGSRSAQEYARQAARQGRSRPEPSKRPPRESEGDLW